MTSTSRRFSTTRHPMMQVPTQPVAQTASSRLRFIATFRQVLLNSKLASSLALHFTSCCLLFLAHGAGVVFWVHLGSVVQLCRLSFDVFYFVLVAWPIVTTDINLCVTVTCVSRPDGEGAYQGCSLLVVGFSIFAKLQLLSAVVKSATNSAQQNINGTL